MEVPWALTSPVITILTRQATLSPHIQVILRIIKKKLEKLKNKNKKIKKNTDQAGYSLLISKSSSE